MATRSKSISSPNSNSIMSSNHLPSPANSGGLRKKPSLPTLVGQGYSFGSSGKLSMLSDSIDSAPSPYSEVPPNLRIPPMPNLGARAAHALGSGANNSPSASTANISWNKSFIGGAAANMDTLDSDEETMHAEIPPLPSHPASIRSPGESRDRLASLPSGINNARSDNGIPSGYNLGRRTSVSAESIDPSSLSSSSHPLPKTIIPKTTSQRSRIETSIEKNLLFRNLDEEQHTDVLNAMKEVRVSKGMEVIVQGAVGDFFYVVESGEFQVWVKPQQSSGMVMSPPPSTSSARARSLSPGATLGDPESKDDGTTLNEDGTMVRGDGSKLVASISSGGSFGELALMYNAPRAATVLCHSTHATLWALDRVTFRTILMEHTSKKRRMYEKFLSEVPILVSLEAHERSKIADALEERIYEEGEDVVREGELGKNFYIIESGKAEVLKKKGEKSDRVGSLSKGDYFGGELTFFLFHRAKVWIKLVFVLLELALLNSAPRAATVRPFPGSGRLRVATLGEKAFTRLLGPVVEILTRRAERNYGPASSAPTSSVSGGAASGNGPGGLTTTPTSTSSPSSRNDRDRERESGVPVKASSSSSSKYHTGNSTSSYSSSAPGRTATPNNGSSSASRRGEREREHEKERERERERDRDTVMAD